MTGAVLYSQTNRSQSCIESIIELDNRKQGPYSWNILVLRVAPSNTILRKFLEMWVFPLKFKEKILVKKKVIQKAS